MNADERGLNDRMPRVPAAGPEDYSRSSIQLFANDVALQTRQHFLQLATWLSCKFVSDRILE
jgi:hypothetical protein